MLGRRVLVLPLCKEDTAEVVPQACNVGVFEPLRLLPYRQCGSILGLRLLVLPLRLEGCGEVLPRFCNVGMVGSQCFVP